ncbi:hypothetical protein PENSPDRAFT_650844 [Peniophora sp. CONT]|nr:hypothetical protein PENSPDRAFT_650844 [Peniophora sp. CONT]
MKETRNFPTILPLDTTIGTDIEVTPHALEQLLQADQVLKEALVMGSLHAIPTDKTSLLETSATWLEDAARTMHRRIAYLASVDNELANSRTPVASLPTELLRTIFQYDADKHRLKRNKRDICHSWMRLGMVCRWWRRVLFNMPRVWADDLCDLGFEKGLQFLPLAKGAPLNVVLREKDKIFEDRGSITSATPGLSCAIWSAQRIRYTPSVAEDASRFLDLLCSNPLPTLESLTMDCSDCDTGDILSEAVMAESPKLRYLHFEGVFALPSAPGQLRSLSIELWDSGHKPSMDMLLDLLSQCPVLRELSLQSALDSQEVLSPKRRLERLRLPCVTSLHLYHEEMLSTVFLDRLSVPKMKKLQFGDDGDTEHALNDILRAWVIPLPREGDAPLLSSISARLIVELEGELEVISQDHRRGVDDTLHRSTKELGIKYRMKDQNPDQYTTFTFKRQI